jgi:hypothetical protein
MAEMMLRKATDRLIPMPESTEAFNRIGDGEIIAVKWKHPRNIDFHRKFFAALNVGFQNQDRYATIDQFRWVFLIETGHADPVITDKGEVHWMPISISFEKMDQIEFEKLYSDLIDWLVAKHVFDGSTHVEQEIMRFL